ALFMLPLVLLERRKLNLQIRGNISKSEENTLLLNGWKSHKKMLLYLGINFAIAQILFFAAYELAGAINGSLAQQTSIIFALVFGFFINHERVKKTQIIFSFVLLFGLTFAITQGSFNLLEFNVGVGLMIITTAIWMIAHSLTRPILDRDEITATQLVFIRNIISGAILFSTYFIFFPLSNIYLLFDPINMFFFVAIGFFYAFDVLYWYRAIQKIDVSKATIIVSPMPILVAFLAYLILGEIFTIYHLIGTLIVIGSIIIIVRKKE
ncbi:MAG: DMT family transporter, partial [Promethearchaeota archaeon]